MNYIMQIFFNVRFTLRHYWKSYGLPIPIIGTFDSTGTVVWLCGFCFKGRAFWGFIIKEQWDGSLNRMDRWKTCSLFVKEAA